MFGRNKEVPQSAEAGAETPQPVEARARRERPDFDAMAQQNRENFKQKYQSKWEGLKQRWNKAVDFVITIKPRTAYAAGLAKDSGVEGARFVANKAVEGGQAVSRVAGAGVEAGVGGIRAVQDKVRETGQAAERVLDATMEGTVAGAKYVGARAKEVGQDVASGARTTAEFGLGAAVVGAETLAAGGKYVYKEGKEAAELAWQGINNGVESAQKRFGEARMSIADKFRRAKEAVLGRAEMIRYKGEQTRINAMRAMAERLTQAANLNEQKIQARVQERLQALGISREESQSSESGMAA